MNDSEMTISAEQTIRVHSSILRQFQKATVSNGDPSTCIKISGKTSDSFGVPDVHEGEDQGRSELSDNSDGEEHLMDPAPFSNLLARLSATSSNGGKRPASSTAATVEKANASAPPSKKARENPDGAGTTTNTKKRQGTPSGPSGKKRRDNETSDPPPSVHQPTSLAEEDQDFLNEFIEKAKEIKQSQPSSSDDTSFSQWCKITVAEIQSLKAQVQIKRKSLNRRKGDTSELTAAIDAVINDFTNYQTFVKQLGGQGTKDALTGRALYDEVSAQVEKNELTLCPAIWERVIKSVAMEDCKV